jgi:hypothetical protein
MLVKDEYHLRVSSLKASRRKIQRKVWTALNSRGPAARKGLPWYIPRVPSIISMLKRSMFLFFFTAFVWSIEIISILGEDVFWKFQVIDRAVTTYGTTIGDIFILVSVMTYGLIWGIGLWWVVGFFDRWFE